MARKRGRTRRTAKRHVKSFQIFFAILIAGWLTNSTGVRAQDEPSMKEVMSGDCFSCHKIDQDDVGPAWISVADRYHHDSSKAPYLANRIRNGGVGDWGKVAMPAHDYLSQKLALAAGILYLVSKGLAQKGTVKEVQVHEHGGQGGNSRLSGLRNRQESPGGVGRHLRWVRKIQLVLLSLPWV